MLQNCLVKTNISDFMQRAFVHFVRSNSREDPLYINSLIVTILKILFSQINVVLCIYS